MKKYLAFLLIFSITLPCFAASSRDASEYITKAIQEGIIFGDEKGVFRGDENITRAEFLAIAERFWGLAGGENVFSDVSEDDWFCKSIAAANLYGIFSGTPEGEARPYEPIRTEDAISVIGRYYNAKSHKGSYIGLSEYAKEYFGYAFENGMFSDFKRLPNPKNSIAKVEALALFYRYQEKNEQTDFFYDGYPKIAAEQHFNSLSIEVITKTDCDISYAIREKGSEGYSWTSFPEPQKADVKKTIRITADAGKIYDVYVKAVSKENGRSRISEFTEIAPIAFIKGDGSRNQPYVVYTENQLRQISMFPQRYYVLGRDIQILGDWTPIRNFSGSLDGDGYRIYGIKLQGNIQKAGLFGNIEGGTVRNLTVDATVNVKEIAGIIAGENNGGVIDGCTVTGNVSVNGASGGGICGINRGMVTNCLSCAYQVKADSFAGGIAGQNCGDIEKCLSAAEAVMSDMYAGGIAGTNNGGYIADCVAANIAVYNTMTYNGGKISTNRNDGIMENNYSFADMVSNAAQTEMSENSRNGLELLWDSFIDENFYYEIGWSEKDWKRARDGFRLVCPKNAAEPILENGRTAYFPQKISTPEDFADIGKNGKGHYVLAKDITLKMPWKTIDIKEGFSGTLDGDGHTVYNLILKGETGLFSNITGGTVKNLNIDGVKATFNGSGGVIAACNYGYIENCTVSGSIETAKAEKTGVITGENNGRIEGCFADAAITVKGTSIETGGICGTNSGVISKSAFSGKIISSAENAVIGGICGTDNEGYISESAAKAVVTANGESVVFAGVCAVAADTQIYKCAALGEAKQSGTEIISGGICAAAFGSTVYNCFSQLKIIASGESLQVGGICAAIEASNVQNTYSSGEINALGEDGVAGGICAVAEDSFISQNVAMNLAVVAEKASNAIVGEYENCDISDNYSRQEMRRGANAARGSEKNGTAKSDAELLKAEFYLKPLYEKGLLGWDDDAWTKKEGCALPVLTDTPLMEYAKTPIYK